MFRACKPRLSVPSLRQALAPARANLRHVALSQRRMASFAAENAPKSRWSSLTTALLVGGTGLTAYGIWDLYSLMNMWPEELQEDLRAGIKAKLAGDYILSSQYIQRAWNTSKTMPLEPFKSEPFLKLSGIAIALADVYEKQGDYQRAYEVYEEALERLKTAKAENKLGGPERLRAVSLAARLGTMAQQLQKPAADEEKHLSWAAEEVLRMVKEENIMEQVIEEPSEDTHVTLADLSLPEWVTVTDLGAPLEQLAGFYARTGKLNFAMPLYLQVISLLIPPPPKTSPPEDRCRGAQMMGHLTELIIRGGNGTPAERLAQAEAWARKSLSIAQNTKRTSPHQIPMCEIAYAVALFNMGMMREISGDKEHAKEFVHKGMEQSRAIGMEEGVKVGAAALERMGEVAADQAEAATATTAA